MIYNLPKSQSVNVYSLISDQVKQNLPLNVGLIFDKYVNKFVTGYFENQRWNEGKQSEIKKQIYLLREERVNTLEELRRIINSRGELLIRVREGRNVVKKRLKEILNPILKELEMCNVDNAINLLNDAISKFQNTNISNELQNYVRELSKIKLSLPLFIIDRNLYETYYNRVKLVLDNLRGQNYAVEEEIHELNWRLIINLGAASVYEVSLLFHRNYSVPYIPGSAVKGVTRYWTILKFAEEIKNQYENAIKEVDKALESGKDLEVKVNGVKFDDMIKIFGTQNKKGEVIFFDALPVIKEEEIERNKDFIVLDVMNVHYRDYYQDESGRIPPGDWMNPNPVFFLAVGKETKFRFALSSRKENLVKKAKELLKEALREVGIGAKTSAGYGYFEA